MQIFLDVRLSWCMSGYQCFKGMQCIDLHSQRSRTACLLNMKALWSFNMSGTSTPWHSVIFQKMWIPIATTVCEEGEKWHRSYDSMITGRPCHRAGTSEPSYHRCLCSNAGSPCGFLLNKFILGQVFLWDSFVFIPPIIHTFHHQKLVQQATEPRNSSLTTTSK